MKQHTPEEMFFFGAEAMRAEAAARLMVAGEMGLVQKLLVMPLPKFQIPERMELPAIPALPRRLDIEPSPIRTVPIPDAEPATACRVIDGRPDEGCESCQ